MDKDRKLSPGWKTWVGLESLRRTLWISADPPKFDYTIFYTFMITLDSRSEIPKKYTFPLIIIRY